MSKRKFRYEILLVLIFAITLFIFGNSIVGYDMSQNTSNSVSEIILPDKYSGNETILLIIRKIAHLVEYAMLGFSVMLFVKCVEVNCGKKLYASAFFYVLLIAVLDEHIQSFSDRTSSTGDILLDFFGTLIGFTIVLSLFFIFVKRKNMKKLKEPVITETESIQRK